ncbi:ribonuclease H-like domain-containing protein [Mycolicibacter virginiensis]|uniref:Recombinase RecB n=1 Tax=Mycolicibacter virginiensis TaxID=1795032 RepID=A0A9X7IQY0_9MYCO|nr:MULTISPECIES: ribonuclease H-like domain-containing protein [Mycobacteriaceae]PQM53779.1 recombinase RecB [Mycolicibacter virginiensis]ULP49480.1 ribonuclease H-like domain-containing protein [Mycolicibacter virginiensis]
MAPVTLGGYPAKRCARVTHNEFAPGTPEPAPPRPDLELLRSAGIEFEEHVLAELRSRYADSERLLLLDAGIGWTERQRRTVAAMTAGVEVIAGGSLPDINGRRGLPDVLVRHQDGYLPVDIKNHRTLTSAKRAEVEISTLSQPDRRLTHPGHSDHGARWRDDVMQLAHYTRMLQELGFHCGVNRGGIIGSTDLTALLGESLGITWYDLDTENIVTYSASDPSHRRPRSALQRYDHEFAFRVDVARAAAAGRELVRPYRIADCGTCAWFDHCATVAGEDDASFAIETGHLTIREWQYLYQHCGDGAALSVAQLAAVDVGAHLEAFRVQSVGTKMPQDRLSNVVRRARMSCTGIDFEAHDPGSATVPTADIEVDFDIEWDDQGRIYQWGLRVRDGQDDSTARYQPVVSFDPLDEAGEAELAAEFASRMQQLRSHAAQAGKSLQVFHWHHPEISSTRRFAEVQQALDGLTYDLRKWFDATFFVRTASSIKQVAGFFGFHWEVDDPGGLASLGAVEAARGNGPQADAARNWCLSYNECDVAAQAAIRDGVRAYRR